MNTPKSLHSEEDLSKFVKDIQQNKKHVIQFSASWCQRCPDATKLITDFYHNKYSFVLGKVDTSEERELIEIFQITKLPALVIYSTPCNYTVHQDLSLDKIKVIFENNMNKLFDATSDDF